MTTYNSWVFSAMKQYKIFSPSSQLCTNCSQTGHQSKQCPQPITSYGVIMFRVKGADNTPWNQAEALVQPGQTSLTGLEGVQGNIEYLLILRKDSIGFIEIMRGKYRVTDHDYIKQHIAGMTGEEREKLLTHSFDALWEGLWGPPQEGTHAYKNEKEQARQKLEALRPDLEKLIKECAPPWATPEWGFPKGRKDIGESEYACAMRELWEETNITDRQIITARNMDPIKEIFVGTNGVQYCHKYYIAYAPLGIGEESIADAAKTNHHIQREVGCIKWFSYKEAIEHIRPDNPEKREVLTRVNKILQTYCALQLPALIR
jgi:8-oxo-dGTP pyrophosphatase MutT (NUDIX family)